MSEPKRAKTQYEFVRMPLKNVLTVLIDHCFSFDSLRNMSVVELAEAMDRVNAGEILSRDERETRRKAELQAIRVAYRNSKK